MECASKLEQSETGKLLQFSMIYAEFLTEYRNKMVKYGQKVGCPAR
jgi:hypothetical protein